MAERERQWRSGATAVPFAGEGLVLVVVVAVVLETTTISFFFCRSTLKKKKEKAWRGRKKRVQRVVYLFRYLCVCMSILTSRRWGFYSVIGKDHSGGIFEIYEDYGCSFLFFLFFLPGKSFCLLVTA